MSGAWRESAHAGLLVVVFAVGDGVGRSGQRVLPSRDGRSHRALSGESAADSRSPGTGRARARGGDPGDAAHRRHARGTDVAQRLGYTAIAFGVWDIFYYVFLRLMCGWPKSLFDWDILFLLPLPWWGPVLAPVCIAVLMIVWGTFASQSTDRRPATSLTWTLWGLSALGIALALYVFMADALRTVPSGAGRDETGAADGVQLVGVLCGARAHGGAGGADWLAHSA